MSKPDTMLWLDDHRGQYIPRDFANSFANRDRDVAGVDPEQWTILEDPGHADYWDEWDYVLREAAVTDENGVIYTLHQDGALWLVPNGMEWDDETETFIWPQQD